MFTCIWFRLVPFGFVWFQSGLTYIFENYRQKPREDISVLDTIFFIFNTDGREYMNLNGISFQIKKDMHFFVCVENRSFPSIKLQYLYLLFELGIHVLFYFFLLFNLPYPCATYNTHTFGVYKKVK